MRVGHQHALWNELIIEVRRIFITDDELVLAVFHDDDGDVRDTWYHTLRRRRDGSLRNCER
jgi:hypothetical protein